MSVSHGFNTIIGWCTPYTHAAAPAAVAAAAATNRRMRRILLPFASHTHTHNRAKVNVRIYDHKMAKHANSLSQNYQWTLASHAQLPLLCRIITFFITASRLLSISVSHLSRATTAALLTFFVDIPYGVHVWHNENGKKEKRKDHVYQEVHTRKLINFVLATVIAILQRGVASSHQITLGYSFTVRFNEFIDKIATNDRSTHQMNMFESSILEHAKLPAKQIVINTEWKWKLRWQRRRRRQRRTCEMWNGIETEN